jgi:hypothetical protein
MDIKKRKEPINEHPASASDEVDAPQPKRQRKNNDGVEIRAHSGQPLSRKERRNLERNEQQRQRSKRQGRDRADQRKIALPEPELELVEEPDRDDEELTAMLSVVDFAKEAEPRHLGQDTKTLYLKHASTEDTHFRGLVDNLRWFDDKMISPHRPSHPSQYKRKWSGWQAEELRRSNSLDMVGCAPSDLNNPIHPIFRFDNFDRCPCVVYDQFLPALRLASQFITHPACARYWITLFFGLHHHDPILTHQLGYNAYRLPKLEEFSPEAALRALQLFEQISHHVTFDFKPQLLLNDVFCYGVARCESKMLQSTHQYLPTDETNHSLEWEKLLGHCESNDSFDPMEIHTRIHLSADFYAYARYTRKLTYADEAVRLRFSLFFANVLIHELAHVVEMRRLLLEYGRAFREAGRPFDRTPVLRSTETFLYDWNVAEAGRGFEMTTFGASVQPINHRCDGAAGLHTSNHPSAFPPHVFHALPMSYVNAIQRQNFWDDQSVPEIIRLLRIPKTGVPAINCSTMTTLSWKEYLHIQEEEGKGQYHSADLSEPSANESGHSAKRQSSASSGRNDNSLRSAGKASSGSSDSLPVSPLDPALKKAEELTLADKWKLAAEYFVLEGGLSIGFHMQRTMGKLVLPENMQPWNRKSWQQEQLTQLLSMRASKKAEAAFNTYQRQGENLQHGEPMAVDASKEFTDFVKAAAIADNPVKAEKWRCLEEMVWLYGSNKALRFLHTREAGNLDFTGIEQLDPDRPDSFGPDVMERLQELRITFIRKRIGEEKRTTFSFPPLTRVTSEDERQEILNFFRPITERVKVGGLPTPARPAKETAPAPKSTGIDVEQVKNASSQKSEERKDQLHDSEVTEMVGEATEDARDGEALEADQESQPQPKPLQGDDDLIDFSDKDELLGPEAPNLGIQGSEHAFTLATPPESETGNPRGRTEIDEQLPEQSTPADIPPPAAPISNENVHHDEQLDGSSWPPDIEGELDELEEPNESVTLKEQPARRNRDSDTAMVDMSPHRPDGDRSRSRSPRKEMSEDEIESSEDELGFGTSNRTPSPLVWSEEPPFVMLDEVKENVPARAPPPPSSFAQFPIKS